MSSAVTPVRGMNDVLPEQAHYWQFLEATARQIFDAYGYREIRVPLLERTELFKRSIGEVTDIVEKEMYAFEDRNGDQLALRPEATAGIVRAALTHGLVHNRQEKLFCLGPMFRRERPQKGRYRQFYQIDVEALGFEGPDVDAELILMSARLLQALGVTNLKLEINSLGTAESRLRYRQRLVEYFGQYRDALDADSLRRLERNPLRILDSKNPSMTDVIAEAPRLADDLDAESVAHFDALKGYLTDRGIEFVENPRLVRGLDYYSRTVFEWLTDQLGAQSAVCSGGRYDGLIEQLGGRATPAVGWALGVERLVELIKIGGVPPVPPTPLAYVIMLDEPGRQMGLRWLENLRDRHPTMRLFADCQGGSLKSQLRRADKSGADFALLIGAEEAAAARATLKNLKSGGQEQLDFDGLDNRLASAAAA
jgi:histidyl-tRNA synthetase